MPEDLSENKSNNSAGTPEDISKAILVFSSGKMLFGIRIQNVLQVAAAVEFFAIPKAPAFTLGLMKYSGNIYTAIDTAALFAGSKPSPGAFVIILNDPIFHVGLSVDAILTIIAPPKNSKSPVFNNQAVELIDTKVFKKSIMSAFQVQKIEGDTDA